MNELLIACLAGIFALSGSLIGSRLSRSNEHSQWLRNEKIKAYNDYLAVFGGGHMTGYFDVLEGDESDSPALDSLARIEELHKLCVRVIILAPAEIARVVQDTLDEVLSLKVWSNELPNTLRDQYYTPGMSSQARSEAGDALKAKAFELLQERLHTYVQGSMGRLESIANLMREDLRVADDLAGKRRFPKVRWPWKETTRD